MSWMCGRTNELVSIDTWHWSMVPTDRAYRRLGHTATQIGSYLFIMGGHDGTTYTKDLLLFNLGEQPSTQFF